MTEDNQTVVSSYTYGDSNERLILEEAGVRTYYACDGKAEYTESEARPLLHGPRATFISAPDGSKFAFVSTRVSIVETWQETDDDGTAD